MFEPSNYHELVDESGTRAALYNIFADALARKLDESWLNLHFQGQLKSGLPDIEGKEELLEALAQATREPEFFKEVQLDYDALFIVPGPKLMWMDRLAAYGRNQRRICKEF